MAKTEETIEEDVIDQVLDELEKDEEEPKSTKKSAKKSDAHENTKDLIKELRNIYNVSPKAKEADKKEAKKKKESIGRIEDVGASCTHYWDTGNYVLNYNISGNMIHGGWMGGKIHQLVGDPHTGKSLLVSQFIATATVNDPDCVAVIMDSESAIDKDSIAALGGDSSRVVYFPIETVEDVIVSLSKVLTLKKAKDPENEHKWVIGIDSLAMLSTKHELEDPNKVDFTKAKKIRQFFRMFANAMYRYNITVIGTNHLIANIGGFGSAQTTTGGSGFNYASSCTLHLLSPGKEKDKENSAAEVVETTIRPWITKIRGRGGRLFRKCEVVFHYSTGIDRWSGMTEHLVKYNIVKPHSTAGYFSFEFEGVVYNEKSNRVGIVNTLKKNPELFEKINDLLYDRVISRQETQNMNQTFVKSEDENENYTEDLKETIVEDDSDN